MGMFAVNNKTVTFEFADRILPCQKDRFEEKKVSTNAALA
jgi:hypothetical protein